MDIDAPNYPQRFYRSALFDVVIGGQISSFSRAMDGTVDFRITGLEGRSFIVQASADLKQGVSISTNAAGGGTIQFTDRPSGNFPARFFRLESEP